MEKAKLTTELTDRITALSDGMHLTEVKMIETAAICPNPYESPRKFSPAEVRSLAAELRQKGMSSPLLIQNVGTHFAPLYQLICGEKRLAWRSFFAYRIKNALLRAKSHTDTR